MKKQQQTNAADKHKTFIPDPEAESYLNKKAEKYLREGGNIEDLPDADEVEEAAQLEKQTARKKKEADSTIDTQDHPEPDTDESN